MSKILLVYEDYAELMKLDASLKRVGFDVLSITNEFSLSQQMLAFNPDLVVGSGKGSKVSAQSLGKRLKEMARWSGKVILIFPPNHRPSPQDLLALRSNMILEAPVPTPRLLSVISVLLDLDEVQILERYQKAQVAEKALTDAEAIMIKGTLQGYGDLRAEEAGFEHFRGDPSESNPAEVIKEAQRKAQEDIDKAHKASAEKVAKYKEITKDIKLSPKSTITRVEAHQRQQELAADNDGQNVQEQDELRKEFTKALFKK